MAGFSQSAPGAPAAPSPLNPGWSASTAVNQQQGVQRSTSAGSYSNSEESSTEGARARRSGGGEYGSSGVLDGLARGEIGSAYGPYTYQHSSVPNSHSVQPLLNSNGQPSHSPSARFSTALSESSFASYSPSSHANSAQRHSLLAESPSSSLAWDEKDPEMDDEIHRTDVVGSKGWKRTIGGTAGRGKWAWSTRGFFNVLTLAVLIGALLTLFAGYPIITYFKNHRGTSLTGAFNLGGINGSGQVPDIPNLPTMIDRDTPENVKSRIGFDGKTYNLIFSDEFEEEGRTFWPGDDPFWEAVDFHYWPTADYEWYSPRGAVTRGGNLVLTQSERESHGLNFESAMLQTWNKFCFTRGYTEVSVSLPGNNKVGGYWPGVWLMGNLGRPGYGATTEGTWPYSYDSCDVGTFPNQTFANGSGPEAALTTGYNGGSLSFLPGQKLSSCTCPGQDHPGPNVNVGRGAPEIDIIEAQVDVENELGQVSQSFQLAPFDDGWHSNRDEAIVYDSDILKWNSYEGGPFQQAASGLAYIPTNTAYNGNFETYGLEYWGSDDDQSEGYITWHVGGQPTWQLRPTVVGPNAATGIGQRIIPREPMTIILNFGMSDGFQKVDFFNLVWPAEMLIDYVRVYQIEGEENWGCDPPDYPTADYIDAHPQAYQNANATIWSDAGFSWPRNRLYDGC